MHFKTNGMRWRTNSNEINGFRTKSQRICQLLEPHLGTNTWQPSRKPKLKQIKGKQV